MAVPLPFRTPVIVVESVRAGVVPPLELPASPFTVATETAVTPVPGGVPHVPSPRQNVEDDLTERQMAVMQRIMAEAAKMPTSPPEGGEAAGGVAAPDRGGSGSDRGTGGAA
jgi:hypothetical protein